MNTVFYRSKGGRLYSRYELESAYLITTGKSVSESLRDFAAWLNHIWGKWIVEAINANNLSYEELLRSNNKIVAIKMYREKNGCTLLEAKLAIDKMEQGV